MVESAARVYTSTTGRCGCGHTPSDHGIGNPLSGVHCRVCSCRAYSPVTHPVGRLPESPCRAFRPVEHGWQVNDDGRVLGGWRDTKCAHCGVAYDGHPPAGMIEDRPTPSAAGTLVNVHRIQNPHKRHTTLMVGRIVGSDTAVVVLADADPALEVQRYLQGDWASYGINVWVPDGWRRVYTAVLGDDGVTPGVYTGQPVQASPQAKPTLVEGQGVVMIRSRIERSDEQRRLGTGHDPVYDVVYDPTDPKMADCGWPEGTVITDVPGTMLVANANWRRYIPRANNVPVGPGWIGSSQDEWARGMIQPG